MSKNRLIGSVINSEESEITPKVPLTNAVISGQLQSFSIQFQELSELFKASNQSVGNIGKKLSEASLLVNTAFRNSAKPLKSQLKIHEMIGMKMGGLGIRLPMLSSGTFSISVPDLNLDPSSIWTPEFRSPPLKIKRRATFRIVVYVDLPKSEE